MSRAAYLSGTAALARAGARERPLVVGMSGGNAVLAITGLLVGSFVVGGGVGALCWKAHRGFGFLLGAFLGGPIIFGIGAAVGGGLLMKSKEAEQAAQAKKMTAYSGPPLPRGPVV